MIFFKLLIFMILPLVSGFAFSASFDCDKALTRTEKLICSNDDLGSMDKTLINKYKKALSVLNKTDKREFRNSQKRWLKLRNKACNNAHNCKAIYLSRITSLEKLISKRTFSKQLILNNTESHTVPNGKKWILRNISQLDCRVCIRDLTIDSG